MFASELLTASNAQAVTLGPWQNGTPFLAGNTEVGATGAYNGILYYIGGEIQPTGKYSNSVYYTTIDSDGGIGSWAKSPNSYPGAGGIWALQCPSYDGFVYCIGGNKVPGGTTNAVYFASITAAGFGAWKSTTSYPIKIRFDSCIPYNGYMYCVGGSPSANSATKSTYFAPIESAGGLGTWSPTTSFPITAWTHCVAYSGFIYCEADYNGAAIADLTYYAPISTSGIGTWSAGPNYPITKEKIQCIEAMGSMICVGGGNGVGGLDGNQGVNNIYVSALSSTGLGNWMQTTSYPVTIKDHSCTTYNNYIYCIGGDDPKTTDAVYYSLIS